MQSGVRDEENWINNQQKSSKKHQIFFKPQPWCDSIVLLTKGEKGQSE